MNTHGGSRPGAGRPVGSTSHRAKHRKLRPILLSDEEADMARKLGEGNTSLGVRRAIYRATRRDPALAE